MTLLGEPVAVATLSLDGCVLEQTTWGNVTLIVFGQGQHVLMSLRTSKGTGGSLCLPAALWREYQTTLLQVFARAAAILSAEDSAYSIADYMRGELSALEPRAVWHFS